MPCNLISSCFFLESPWFREQDCSQPSADWQSNNNQINGLAGADQPGQGRMGSTAPHIENPAVDYIQVKHSEPTYRVVTELTHVYTVELILLIMMS